MRAKEAVEGGGKALCVGGADEGVVDVEAFIVIVVEVDTVMARSTQRYADMHSIYG